MIKYIFGLFFAAFSINSFCQTTASKYNTVDAFVEKVGALPSKNVAEITEAITLKFKSSEEKARAIFYWIANNIAIDAKAVKQQDEKNKLPENVIELRKATPLGFSLLVQEMCSLAKIRCLSIDGFVKNHSFEINQKAEEKNYSWNVVQLGQSPETWYYIDACRASGYLDTKQTLFTKLFTSEYFFTDKKLFNQVYFPDNMAWQLGGGNKSITNFYSLPIFGNAAIGREIKDVMPITGVIKSIVGKPINFSFSVSKWDDIKKISLLIGDEKKKQKEEPMNFENDNGAIKFSYTFKKDDTYPIQVVINGRVILEYIVEVAEKTEK